MCEPRPFRPLLLVTLMAGLAGAVWAAPTCDAEGADLEAVAAARRAVEVACECDGFSFHGDYVACARRATAAEVAADRLSDGCARFVRRIARRSTCSYKRPKVVCCEERARDGRLGCKVAAAARCVSGDAATRSACATTRFCADTRCDAPAPPAPCEPELLYSSEGNRLRRFDVDTIRRPPLAEDILIERASLGGLDINGQICRLPDGSGRFVAGEDTGQPAIPPGFGVFDATGVRVGKLVPTFQTQLPGATSNDEPFGCAFDADGRLFTSDVGNQASGPGNGQLLVWFPPYDRFPGAPGTFPNADRSTSFCKLAIDIATAGSVAVDPEGRVYVASARGAAVYRFSPPFPTAPDAAGGCGGTDALGSPVADMVTKETFVAGGVFSGIVRSARNTWFIGTVLTGTIQEYDVNGALLRGILVPAANEPGLPLSVGHPQGLALDCTGDLYYADLQLTLSGGGIGPGPNGKVRRIPFDVCNEPGANVIVKEGLAFPDGLGIAPGDLETP